MTASTEPKKKKKSTSTELPHEEVQGARARTLHARFTHARTHALAADAAAGGKKYLKRAGNCACGKSLRASCEKITTFLLLLLLLLH